VLTRPTRPKKLYRWRISRIKGTPAAEAAIKKAIEKFGIKEPWTQRRLVARRVS
jgi:hypothetical protein